MDSDDYRYPIGSPEHYSAYAKEFEAGYGVGYPAPDSPRTSYEADYAYELAFDADQYGGADHPDEFLDRLTDGAIRARDEAERPRLPEYPDIEPELF